MEHVIDRVQLKNTILAVAHQILSSCSVEQLENAVAALLYGDPITLKPHKPVLLEEYEFLIQKIERAMTYRPRRISKPKPVPPPEEAPSDLFTVTVPMHMDVSKLSDMEHNIICQNLDKVMLLTAHPPFERKRTHIKMRARIGIPLRHLYPEQKEAIKAKTIKRQKQSNIFQHDDMQALCLLFVPHIIHHFHKMILWRHGYLGVPP